MEKETKAPLSAEDVLEKIRLERSNNFTSYNPIFRSTCIAAMEEYAAQQTASLSKELETEQWACARITAERDRLVKEMEEKQKEVDRIQAAYKHITAITNANGELEFHARKEERPRKSQPPFNAMREAMYLISLGEWEQSAQVFTAFDLHQKMIIMQEVRIRTPGVIDYKSGVDVTEFVEINETLTGKCGHFAFYKSPSKEEPVADTEESQRDLWNEMVIYWHTSRTDMTIFNKHDDPISLLMSKFKITRLPKA